MVYLGAGETVAAAGSARGVCDLYSEKFLGWVRDQRENLDVELPVIRGRTGFLAAGRASLLRLS